MRKLLVGSALIAVTVSLVAQENAPAPAAPPGNTGGTAIRRPVPAGPVPRLPDGRVDLSGVWLGGGPNGDIERDGGLKPGEVDNLMLPWAKARMLENGKDESRNDPHNYCLPQGVPRMAPFPIRFVQDPPHKAATHMFILFEGNAHMFRQVFMDGRKHPAEIDPTWFGHSIGWFEGDTFVIDSRGFNDRFWFDRRGHPHTEQLHTIERWTRKDLGHMETIVTIDDPGAYTKPFTVKFQAELQPGDELLEYVCLENDQVGLAAGFPNPYVVPSAK